MPKKVPEWDILVSPQPVCRPSRLFYVRLLRGTLRSSDAKRKSDHMQSRSQSGGTFFFLLGFSLKGGLSVAFKFQWFMTKMESFPCLLTVERDLGQISRCHNSDALLQDMREINFKSNKRTLASKVFYDGQMR